MKLKKYYISDALPGMDCQVRTFQTLTPWQKVRVYLSAVLITLSHRLLVKGEIYTVTTTTGASKTTIYV